MREKVSRITRIFLTVLLFVALPLVVFTLITSKSDVLMGIRSFVVLSGSMEPALPVGSMIYTMKQPSYELGEVVSVIKGDVTVTHRIYQTIQSDDKVSYVLKGDANDKADQLPVAASEIVGKQVVAVPHMGQLSAFLRTPIGFISLVVVPALLIVGFELWAIKKELEVQIENRVRNEMSLTV